MHWHKLTIVFPVPSAGWIAAYLTAGCVVMAFIALRCLIEPSGWHNPFPELSVPKGLKTLALSMLFWPVLAVQIAIQHIHVARMNRAGKTRHAPVFDDI